MSLETKLIQLAQAVGTDIKTLKAAQGLLSSLNTTAKNSLVSAINEVKAASSGQISSTDLNNAIDGLRSEMKGPGASAAMDTFKELQDVISSDQGLASALATLVGTKASIASIGDTEHDFVTDYTTSRDS
jgi:hypothetical protein